MAHWLVAQVLMRINLQRSLNINEQWLDNSMSVIITIIHIFVAIALIMIVLLQTGKGADMGLAFGGGSSQTLFGTTGASTFLSKATTIIAVVFMLTTFSLTIMWGKRNDASIMTEYKVPVQNSSSEKTTDPQQSTSGQTPINTPAQTESETTKQAELDTQVIDTPVQPEHTSQPIQQVPGPVETESDETTQ
jgi:preprotein translocase subunit SecG